MSPPPHPTSAMLTSLGREDESSLPMPPVVTWLPPSNLLMVFNSRSVCRSSSPSQLRSSISSFWLLLLEKEVIFYPIGVFPKSIRGQTPLPKPAPSSQGRPLRPSKRTG